MKRKDLKKKLVLARETVKNLDRANLEQVQGGSDKNSYYCGFSYTQACTTQQPKSIPYY